MLSENRNITLLKQAWDGLNFVMDMFAVVSAPKFPRTILTGASRKPHVVNSRDEVMAYFEPALFEDCYINAYPNYEAIGKTGAKTLVPNHIMIDLDRAPFNSDAELESALADTLNNVRNYITGISGEYPIVVASGSGGYHIHIPLPGLRTPLQDMPEFEAFRDDQDLNDKFLRYAERRLSNNKADHHHNPSINSCMFRVPGTINTKARAAGVKDPTVRVVRGFDHINQIIARRSWLPASARQKTESRPTTKFLNDFYAFLVQQRIDDNIIKSDRRLRALTLDGNNNNVDTDRPILWIEKLLSIGVEDGRKDLLFWVLAPYLMTVRKMGYDKAYCILEGWLDKCNEVRSLEPGRTAFRYRIRYCLDTAENQERMPIRFDTFKEYYPELYKKIHPHQ